MWSSAGCVWGLVSYCRMLDLEKIGLDLRKGVRIRNYRRLFRLHQNCFLGSDAVKFLVEKKLAVDERDAVLLGRKLLRNGLFRHVTNERDFKNEKELYRFTQDDEDVQPVGMVFAADLDDEEALEVVEVLRNNLVIKNRRRKLLLFKNCFVGSDAVSPCHPLQPFLFSISSSLFTAFD